MTNARQFLDEIAAILREAGREVEITETEESFCTFVWMSAIGPRWYDRSINLSAVKDVKTGRWRLGKMQIGPGAGSRFTMVRTKRSDIRIAAEVYR